MRSFARTDYDCAMAIIDTDQSLTDWPFIAASSPRIVGGEGAWLIADDGRRILDAAGGAIVGNVGYGRPEVAEAIARASSAFVVPTWRTPEREALAARLRRSWLPAGLHHIHLTSGGSEGVEAAVKIALQHAAAKGERARVKVMARELSYHGTTIAMAGLSGHEGRKRGLEGFLTTYPRIPTPWPLRCPLGSHHPDAGDYYLAATRAAIEAEGPETVAALVVEAVTGTSGGAIVPLADYLPGIRSLCDEYGILMIVDEVMTGFRVGLRGAQGLYGIRPDLTTLGKVVGGGMPLGAFGGRRDIMQRIAPLGPVYQAGTLSGNPLAVAAGLATLRLVQTPGFFDHLRETAGSFVAGLCRAATGAGVAFSAQAVGGMFGLYFSSQVPNSYADVMACDREAFSLFFHSMLDEGVYLAPSAFEAGFVSTAHTFVDIEQTLQAAQRAFARIKAGRGAGTG